MYHVFEVTLSFVYDVKRTNFFLYKTGLQMFITLALGINVISILKAVFKENVSRF